MKIILKDGSVLNIPDFKIASISYEDNDSVVKAEESDLEFEFDKEGKTGKVKRVKDKNITVVKIPSKVQFDGEIYSVTEIGNLAFSGCSSLTSIEIPNSVTTIGEDAFSDCSSLTSIEIPNSVTEIGDWAFDYCTSLRSIVVDKSNKVYDSRENCNAIIKTANNKLIKGCQNTVIPNSVTSIGDSAFAYCTSLASIVIPNSVTEIERYAFAECTSLRSIEIPNSVTSIGDSAFAYCTSLASIVIPNSVTSIGDDAFNGCTSLTSIEIPNSVTSIGKEAFSWCKSLTSIEIPNSVTEIGDGAFEYCTSLKTARVPVSLKGKVEYAFPETCMIEWYDESGYAYVDLGLPSGLKWATMNVGATMPEQYGDYFDWDDRLIPEMFDRDYGDKVFELIDLATKKWGDGWRMPTHTEWEELIANCTWEWTQIGNENGYKVQSKVNKNWIFLPATGYRLGESIDDGFAGYYWSSTVYDAYEGDTYYLYFNSSTKITRNGTSRTSSRTVRPVTK